MRGQSFPVAAALDGIWDGLDRVDSRFREVESLGLVRWNHAAQDPLPRPDAWWKFWAKEAETPSRTTPWDLRWRAGPVGLG